MKTYIVIFVTFLFINACNLNDSNGQHSSNTKGTTQASTQHQNQDKPTSNNGKDYWQALKMFEIKDKNGVVFKTFPYPADWVFPEKDYAIRGPGNFRMKNFPLQSYIKNLDPYNEYYYAQMPQRTFPGISQLVQEDIFPWAQNNGFKIVRQYELTEASKIEAWYDNQLFKVNPADARGNTFIVYGVDLESQNGEKAMMVLHLSVMQIMGVQRWNYYIDFLQADKNVFEQVKKQYIFGLEHAWYNPEPIMAYNREEMQRVNQNWAAFNQRMAANQKAFEASQRDHVNRTNAINDAIMSGYKSSSESSDRMQEQRIDAIYERGVVQNPETGQISKLDNGYGYNRYWVNGDGNYIATESQLYNPNLDDNLNQKNWQELNKIK
ncbi:MAG: hypothetical protein LC105_11025 [Chitinophagales bacterium]|nr:hypothetical protein [Chitinophagales bacterium]MCZ2394382.1 hypothetical protein [Chitinophagales bacterium]